MSTPVVIQAGRETVRGHYHEPARRTMRTPVLLCPPFGWEDMCSYRVRRRWADDLAAAGHPVLRFDLPGTGDSTGSPLDPALVTTWTETIDRLASELADGHQAAEIAAIGIGLGGMLALHARDRGAPIGQLALWAVPTSGRRLVRELRAAAALIPPPVGAEPVPGSERWLELTGYVLTEETSAELRAIELSGARTAAPRRVLVLGRDGIAVDPGFVEGLRAAGAEVTLADGMGFGPVMADPERSRVPEETIATSIQWLQDDPDGAAPTAAIVPGRGEPLRARVGEAEIEERAVLVPAPGGDVYGILCVPAGANGGDPAPLAALLLNGGAQRHTGQNRNWVEQARRWAARGIPSLRIDLPGIGDAGGQPGGPLALTDLYGPQRIEQALAALSWLREHGIAERFLLSGLCAGAYWSYHAALADPTVVGLGLINLISFEWSPTLGDQRANRVTVQALRGDLWHKLRHSRRRRHAIARSLRTLKSLRALRQARAGQVQQTDRVGAALAELNTRGCEVDFLIGMAEPITEELHSFGVLERLGQWDRIRTKDFGWEDHAVRALASQRLVAEWLDDLLDRVIAGQDSEVPVAQSAAIPHR